MSYERNELDIQSTHQCNSLAVETTASRKWSVVSISPQSSSCDNSCNLTQASCAVLQVLRLNSGPWATGAVPTTAGPLISSEHTRFSGLSMVWPLCRRKTPLRRRPFFHSPLFFSSLTISTTSLPCQWFRAPVLMWWLSMRPWKYSLFHCWHTCCLIALKLAPLPVCFQRTCTSTSSCLGVVQCPSPQFLIVHTGSLFFPWSCRTFSLHLWWVSYISLPTMAI